MALIEVYVLDGHGDEACDEDRGSLGKEGAVFVRFGELGPVIDDAWVDQGTVSDAEQLNRHADVDGGETFVLEPTLRAGDLLIGLYDKVGDVTDTFRRHGGVHEGVCSWVDVRVFDHSGCGRCP